MKTTQQYPRPKGRRKERGVMNTTERRFLNEVLMPQIISCDVVLWWYEAYSWKLTEKTPDGKPGIRYTPDFVCMLDTGELVVYEVKGVGNARRQDLNRVKLFADAFPFRVYVARQQSKREGGGFDVEEY